MIKYLKYLSLTKKATAAFREKHYKKADTLFSSAFTATGHQFSEDIHLAMQSALAIEHEEKALALAIQLIQRKTPLAFFEHYPEIRQIKRWQQQSTAAMEARSTATSADDQIISQRIISIYNQDQLIARKYKNANVHPDYKKVSQQFIQLVKELGFPSEERVGTRINDRYQIESPYYHVIMLHHYHMNVPLFKEQLTGFLERGLVSPKHYYHYKALTPDGPIDFSKIPRRVASLKADSL